MIPLEDIDYGIPNSDLHMYVGIEDSEENFIAYAYACMTIDDRPSVGVVIFNPR